MLFQRCLHASGASATLISFAHQYKLNGKQPGPSVLDWRAGWKFVLKHCGEAAGMVVEFGNVHPSNMPVKDQMNLLLDTYPFPSSTGSSE